MGRKQGARKLVNSDTEWCQKNSAVFDIVAVISRSITDDPIIDQTTENRLSIFRPPCCSDTDLIFMKHVVYEIRILNTCLKLVMQQGTNAASVLLKLENDVRGQHENTATQRSIFKCKHTCSNGSYRSTL